MDSKAAYNELQRLAARPRAERAYKLKRAGETWATIGKILGVSRQRAQQIAARYRKNGKERA